MCIVNGSARVSVKIIKTCPHYTYTSLAPYMYTSLAPVKFQLMPSQEDLGSARVRVSAIFEVVLASINDSTKDSVGMGGGI